ncbi:MAG: VOC family protein [Actinomycetota bacterium]
MTANDEQVGDGAHGLEHGQPTYLQIPAIDLMRSAAFYEAVFGWIIERPRPSFMAPGMFGQWIDDRRPSSPDAGMMLWIHVDDIEEALERVRSHDGEVLETPSPDGPTRMLATIRDPGGNPIGLVQRSVQRSPPG